MEQSFVRNSTGVLKKVLMCPPDYVKLQPINEVSRKWIGENYEIDKDICVKEQNELIEAYKSNGIEVVMMTPDSRLTNEVFARDFGACIKEGYILGKFKEKIRWGETEAYAKKMEELGVPCAARCTDGYFEGGDFWFLDDKTIVIGMVARSDEKGVDEIRQQLAKYGYEVIGVRAPEEYLHFDLCFNVVAEKLAVICKEVLPESFIKLLEEKNFELIEVKKEELLDYCCNIQAIGNRKVISFKNNKKTNEKLREHGIEVIELNLNEIFKDGGGAHCMTFPLLRE